MSDVSSHETQAASHTLGLLTTSVSEPNIVPQWTGFVELARQRQANSITYVGGVYQLPEYRRANFVFDLAQGRRADGLIILSGNMLWAVDAAAVEQFVAPFRAERPVVCVEKPAGGVTTILMDDYEGMRQMVSHLIEVHGRRRIVFLQGPSAHLGAAERYRGYCAALEQAGIAFDQALVSDESYGWSSEEAHIAARLEALRRKPGVDYDAVVGVSCFVAIAASNVLQRQGVAVPGQVAVVGFDDVVENIIQTPTLTTVRAPFYEMANRAGETLLALLDGKPCEERVTQPVSLVFRQSCGCLEQLVTDAALFTTTRQPTLIAGGLPVLAAKRELWLPRFTQTFLAHADSAERHAAVVELSDEIRYLVDAFFAEVNGRAELVFLNSLRALLQKTSQADAPINAWQSVISALQHFLLPYLDAKTRPLCDSLWHQARVLIGEAAEHHQIRQRIGHDQRTRHLRDIANTLSAAQDVDDMMNHLTASLPTLGIAGCYVALHADPGGASGQARLVLAYAQGQRLPLPAEGVVYPAARLLPDDLYPTQGNFHLLVEPLYFEDTPLGFVVFDVAAVDPALYESLRLQLSNALHKVFVVQAELSVRRQVEEDLRHEQALFQSLMDNLPDVIYYKDRQSRFIRVNPAMARYHGFTQPEALLGKSDFDLFDEEHARPAYEDEQRIIQTGEPLLNFEEKEVFPDGRVAWVSTSKLPLRDADGKTVGTFGVSRDITARKVAEMQAEHRSVQLRTAAEVARAAGSILDLNRLSQEVVDLIQQRFDLYYVGLFMVDETGEWTNEPNRWAVLRAGTGEAGQAMLSQNHKLELGDTSMIGWCILHNEPRIALDVGQDAVHFRNPHLPLTRSELALPLASRGQALGALSIQSAQGQAFSGEDITIFQVMADQLANAIANARLYAATQAALEEMQATNRRYVRQGWESYSAAHPVLGYQQNEQGLQPLGRQILPEVQHALAGQHNQQPDDAALVVPVVLRDQPIGALGFRFDQPNRHWTQEEMDLIEVLTEQFALAAENLRLLDETQRRAERERLTAGITAHIRESLHLDTILRTTVQDVQQALGLSEVVVRLKSPESLPGEAVAHSEKETGD
jgi:PAS domain S-box-containing protein